MARYRRSTRSRRRLARRRRTRRFARRSRRRGFRRFNVSRIWEGPLLANSLIPEAEGVLGSSIGVDGNDFMTWNISPFVDLDQSAIIGKQTRHYAYTVANTSPLFIDDLSDYQKMLTDMPILINNEKLQDLVPSFLWQVCDEYRISYVNISFSVPEFTNEKNNTLYIEWTNLPGARACTPDDALPFLVDKYPETIIVKDNPESQQNPITPQDISDAHGWNWICRPKDIADATSRQGRETMRYGWHRQMLTYTHPVTISFRPRHADIHYDAHAVAADYNGKTHYSATPVDQFATNKYLTREYLPIFWYEEHSGELPHHSYCQYWMGPIIRLTDANRLATANKPTGTLFQEYGIRCTWQIGVKFRGMSGTQELFPDYSVPKI